MGSIIQVRRDTSANWTSTNPTLAQGEMGHETDTGHMKIGTGIDVWTALPYFNTTIVEGGTLDGQTLRWEQSTTSWDASSALIVDDSGNVGIGTTQATAFGAVLALSAPADPKIYFEDQGTWNASIALLGNEGAMSFQNTDGNERMRIDSSGGVLVGLTTGGQGAGTINVSGGYYVNGTPVVLASELVIANATISSLEARITALEAIVNP